MAKRLAAATGWGIGALVVLYVLFVATYGLLAPECVTDGDLRDARLHLALNAAASVAAIGGAIGVTRLVRGRLATDDRFAVGPVFAATLIGLYLVVLVFNALTGAVLDVPGPTAACF